MPNVSFHPEHFNNWRKKTVFFLISQNLSLFGSSVVGFAIVWHITLTTSSGFWMMLATLTFNVPAVLISLWGGVWADRYNRKILIMLADSFVALATLAVASFFLCGYEHLWLLLLASTFRSFGGGVQAPAVNALYPQLVPADQLARVQGLNQAVTAVLMLMSPVVGGLVLGLMGLGMALMVDVVTALIAIIILGQIKIAKVEAGAGSSTWREIKAGCSYVLGHRQLKPLLIFIAVCFFLLAPANVLTPLMVARSFGPEVWRLTANELAWSLTSIVGGVYVSRYGDFKNKPRALALCIFIFGLCACSMGLAGNFVIFLIVVAASGFFVPIYITSLTVFLQKETDPKMIGRVFSINHLLTTSALPTGILFFGPLADLVSVNCLLLASGLAMLVAAFCYYRVSR